MEKNIEPNFDWKKITIPAVGIALLGGIAVGFFARPTWDKARAKKLAAKKKSADKPSTKEA